LGASAFAYLGGHDRIHAPVAERKSAVAEAGNDGVCLSRLPDATERIVACGSIAVMEKKPLGARHSFGEPARTRGKIQSMGTGHAGTVEAL